VTTIHYRNDVRSSGVNGRALVAAARKLMREVGEEGSSLSLSLVTDETIAALNKRFRHKEKATDVLSFPQHPREQVAGEPLLGDVVISIDTARRQAAAYDAPLERELQRLLVHGLLHLLGHDHHETGERRRMEAEERRLAQSIGMPWPYGRTRAR
jgi:probable rRNA maturation factor